jgi:hypothetical protein
MQIAAAAVVLVVVLLLVLLLVALQRRHQMRLAMVAQLQTTPEAAAAAAPPRVDPWAGRESDAVGLVRAHTAASTTVGTRTDARLLETQLSWLSPLELEPAQWVARRIQDTSVYDVRYRFRYHGIDFGPRWLVQVDPQGLRPPASPDGVVATNALAELLHASDPDTLLRYHLRVPEVLQALTDHRFGSGFRLASSLLLYFQARSGSLQPEHIVGWLVVPERIDPEGELHYRAWFQWEEDGRHEDAIWQVSYIGGAPSFRPRDRRAEEIMRQGSDLDRDAVLDIRPMSMREDQDPSTERDDCRRALRWLLRDARVIEGVGALLATQARSHRVEYRNWNVDRVEGDPTRCHVTYRYEEDGDPREVRWQVEHRTGERLPASDLAWLAELTVRPRPPRSVAPAP